MGFFAVLKDPNTDATFTIEECHVNFWVLRGLCGRSTYTWDIGLRIKVGDNPIRNFGIALPSGTDKSGFRDLSDKLSDTHVAQLVFGRPVLFPQGRTIDYGKGPLSISAVPSAGVSFDERRSGPDFSLWNIQLAAPIPSNASAYLRVRFRATAVKRIWQWKRFLLSRYAALADLRISDVREASNVKDGNSLSEHIIPIVKLNFFIVAPSRFHLIATSPPTHYTRILEGSPWEKYLGRKVKLWGNEKLSIYQWRNQGSSVTADNPMRIYLHIGSDFRELPKRNWVLLAVVILLLACYGDRYSLVLPATLTDYFRRAFTSATKHTFMTASSLIIAVLTFLFLRWELVHKRLSWAMGWVDRIESWAYKK